MLATSSMQREDCSDIIDTRGREKIEELVRKKSGAKGKAT